MFQHPTVTTAGGPATPARPLPSPEARIVRRRLTDRLSRVLVSMGGITIILAILAILVVIVVEVVPLFRSPEAVPEGRYELLAGSRVLAAGVDEYREQIYTVTTSGLRLFSAKDGTSLVTPSVPGLEGGSIVSVSERGQGALALGLSDGRALSFDLRFTPSYSEGEGRRRIEASVKSTGAVSLDSQGRPLRAVTSFSAEGTTFLAGLAGPRDIVLLWRKKKKSLVGEGKVEETRRSISIPGSAEPTTVLVDGRGEDLFVGTSDGAIVRVDLRKPVEPRLARTTQNATRNGSAVTVLGFLLGDRALIVGDAAGGVNRWQLLRPKEGDLVLARMGEFEPHAAAVTAFSASQRDKGFVTGDAGGTFKLRYATTGRTLMSLNVPQGPVQAASIAPKADGLVAVDSAGGASTWSLRNPHPEITLASLFGKTAYEGYDSPELVWQSTGGTDDFEAKFSLTPLLFGTLKGTFYALVIAVPLALLSAVYVSQFMRPGAKATVKPLIEVMAALPSVVLGFIAGLWLAPRVEKILPGVFLMPVVVGGCILLALAAWRAAPAAFRHRVKPGAEVTLLVPIVLFATAAAFVAGGWVESSLLGGDYRDWLRKVVGLTYDQRNSVVVGFAMGFAVIPIIFTIAEDSLSNVPGHLTAGSLALGATRWQTAVRVVLPTASPGIFSAVMIGFGRAVGETMIVLMATGNTPVMNVSPFNGFRALSANVAVELPEASEGGTLFRVLFLAALLLFAMTFVVNTLAELVRLRLRRRYQNL
jgi:phosphate transport system permease protein